MYRRGGPGLLTIIYLVIACSAGDHGYIQHDTVGEVVSALLAIVLWPLVVFFDLNLHIK